MSKMPEFAENMRFYLTLLIKKVLLWQPIFRAVVLCFHKKKYKKLLTSSVRGGHGIVIGTGG